MERRNNGTRKPLSPTFPQVYTDYVLPLVIFPDCKTVTINHFIDFQLNIVYIDIIRDRALSYISPQLRSLCSQTLARGTEVRSNSLSRVNSPEFIEVRLS